jgi:hypothetical protein
MKLVQGLAQPKPLNEIKNALIAEFKKPKSESQCITELKEIKQKVETYLGVRSEIQDPHRKIDL